MDRRDGEVCDAPPAGRGCSAVWGPGRRRCRCGCCAWTGWAATFCAGATGRAPAGSSPVAGISSLPWDQRLVKGTHTPGKLRKGELKGRSHIYHHVTARHNTCAHVRELYLPRAPRGRPGTRAAAGEEARQSPGGMRATPASLPRGRLRLAGSRWPARDRGAFPVATEPAECGASQAGRPEAKHLCVL